MRNSLPFDRDAAVDLLAGRPVVLSVSGGKDSTATGLLLKEWDIPFVCVHLQTGWEHEITDHYVREVLPGVLGPIHLAEAYPGGMEGLCEDKGMFPKRTKRFCTQELKVKPFLRWVRAYEEAQDTDVVNAVGIRAAESEARSGLPEWEFNESMDLMVWRPIVRFSVEDVVAIHARHGILPSPLYLRGATRVGCWPCIFARKKEIRLVSEIDPGRIDRLEALEGRVRMASNARQDAKGTPHVPLAFFRSPVGRTNKAKGTKAGDPWPIRKVVEWSKTARGGKQLEMFPDYETDGCMRWGLCETDAS